MTSITFFEHFSASPVGGTARFLPPRPTHPEGGEIGAGQMRCGRRPDLSSMRARRVGRKRALRGPESVAGTDGAFPVAAPTGSSDARLATFRPAPEEHAVPVNLANPVKRNAASLPRRIPKLEGASPGRGEDDVAQGHALYSTFPPVEEAEVKASPSEFSVPTDAIQQFVNRDHANAALAGMAARPDQVPARSGAAPVHAFRLRMRTGRWLRLQPFTAFMLHSG